MKNNIVPFILALGLTGCATSSLPGTDVVTYTKNPADVANCKFAGTIYTTKKHSKEFAISKGADTVYLRSNWLAGTWDGGGTVSVYNCKGIDIRQPLPVQVK